MTRPPSSGGFSPTPSASPVLCCAPGVCVRPLRTPLSIQSLWKKAGHVPSASPLPVHTCALTSRVFTCAVPRGACCRAGNAGMEARAGEWEGLRALPETARYSDPGPPLRTGVEALAQRALGAQLRGEERGGGRARGTCLGREGRARRHFRRGRDRGLQRRSRPSAAAARPQLARLHPRRLGPWVSSWDPRSWRTTRVSQEGQWAASFPHLGLYLRIFKSQEHKHIPWPKRSGKTLSNFGLLVVLRPAWPRGFSNILQDPISCSSDSREYRSVP